MSKIAYKVVRFDYKERPVSIVAHGSYEVVYKIGRFVAARQGHPPALFVFNTLRHAKQAYLTMKIYRCEVQGPVSLPIPIDEAPKGTLGFRKVKLLRCVRDTARRHKHVR